MPIKLLNLLVHLLYFLEQRYIDLILQILHPLGRRIIYVHLFAIWQQINVGLDCVDVLVADNDGKFVDDEDLGLAI